MDDGVLLYADRGREDIMVNFGVPPEEGEPRGDPVGAVFTEGPGSPSSASTTRYRSLKTTG